MDPSDIATAMRAESNSSMTSHPPISSPLATRDSISKPDDDIVQTSPYDNPGYVSPKRPKDKPKEWKPFLTSFTLFPELPTEIRQAIWRFTLEPRVVEIHSSGHGFYSDAKVPRALSVCVDSRRAVGHLYPLCFGNIFHEPATVFNSSLDTLYFDDDFGPDVHTFLLSLNENELLSIEYIAVDREINEYLSWDESSVPRDNLTLIRKAVLSMPSLKELHFVCKIDERWHDHGMPEGKGQITLMESWSYEIQHYLHKYEIHREDEDGESECQELPNMDHLLQGFDVPRTGALWGWRPTARELGPNRYS